MAVAVVSEAISEVGSESLGCWSWEDQRKVIMINIIRSIMDSCGG